MSSWLLARPASCQVRYDLLAFVEGKFLFKVSQCVKPIARVFLMLFIMSKLA